MSETWNTGDPTLTPERQEQIRRVVMSGLAAERPRRRRRRVAVVAVGVVCSVAVASGTAAAWVAITSPDESNEGYCSSAVTTDSAVWERNGVASVSAPDGKQEVLDSVDACRAMWRAGIVRAPGSSEGQPVVVPLLSACVVEGRLVVYPSADACKQLGVAELAP
jgi:hypothetical protein